MMAEYLQAAHVQEVVDILLELDNTSSRHYSIAIRRALSPPRCARPTPPPQRSPLSEPSPPPPLLSHGDGPRSAACTTCWTGTAREARGSAPSSCTSRAARFPSSRRRSVPSSAPSWRRTRTATSCRSSRRSTCAARARPDRPSPDNTPPRVSRDPHIVRCPQARLYRLPHCTELRKLNVSSLRADDSNCLIQVPGTVIRTGSARACSWPSEGEIGRDQPRLARAVGNSRCCSCRASTSAPSASSGAARGRQLERWRVDGAASQLALWTGTRCGRSSRSGTRCRCPPSAPPRGGRASLAAAPSPQRRRPARGP